MTPQILRRKDDEVAEAFGRYALIAYADIGELLKNHI